MSNSLIEITSSNKLDFGGKKKGVLLFMASWHEGCGPMEAVLSALAGTAPDIFFGKIDAEEVSALSDEYKVTLVPTIILLNDGQVAERFEGGADPSSVTMAVQRLIAAQEGTGAVVPTPASNSISNPEKQLADRLDKLIKSDTVMVFLKGTPSEPRCGFSRQAVEILQEQQIPFGSFDILTDETVRQGLKKYSNWPTYPQIYLNGELVGGLDILKESIEEGPLKEQWGIDSSTSSTTATSNPLQDRLTKLTNRSNVMVFMKGLPSNPRCGFSRQIIELLDETDVPYDGKKILNGTSTREFYALCQCTVAYFAVFTSCLVCNLICLNYLSLNHPFFFFFFTCIF